MLNGKFYTGLPPKMIDRPGGLNRQQTNFFWPDDSQRQSAVDSRVQRRTSIQAENRDAYLANRGDQSNSDAENKERFKKEFTRSSIQFYDNVDSAPVKRNKFKTVNPIPQKFQNIEPPVNSNNKRKEAFASKIEFFDFADDLNNRPRTDINNKVEVERNTKNSPKLQNKHMSFDSPDESVNFIANDVRNMRIAAPPRRRNTVRDTRSRYGRILVPDEGPHYSDYAEDYHTTRRQPIPPPIRTRYSESDPDFEDYNPRRLPIRSRPGPAYYDDIPYEDMDLHPTLPTRQRRPQFHNDYSDERVCTRKVGRQVHFGHPTADLSQGHNSTTSHSKQITRNVNILRVDNDISSNVEALSPQPSISPTDAAAAVAAAAGPSHKHLVSNICFSDDESTTTTTTPPCPPKRNIRSSAVNRVSVGLPD